MERVHGSLTDKNIFEHLMEWHRDSKSGIITFIRGATKKSILLSKGAIVRAQSNQESEKLGQLLLKKNLISPWDLEVALSQVHTDGKRLGQVLIGMAALKEPVLNQTLVSQTHDIIFSVFDWQEGDYHLQRGGDFSNEILFEQFFTPEVILQGIRRITNMFLLLRPLGNLSAKLRLSSDFQEKIRRISLQTDEKGIISLLPRPASLKDLLASTQMEKLSAYRAIAALLAIGVIQHGEPEAGSGKGPDSGAIRLDASGTHGTGIPRHKLKKQLGEMLVEQNVITEQQLKDALHVQSASKGKRNLLGNVLIQKGYATEDAIIDCLSGQLNIPKVDEIEINEDALKTVPFNLAKKYFICPIRRIGSALEVAMLDPTNMAALDDLSFVTGYRIKPHIATNKALKDAWEKSYQAKEEKAVEKFEKREEPLKRDLTHRNFAKEEEEDSFAEGIAGEGGGATDVFHFDAGELENLVSTVTEDLNMIHDLESQSLPGNVSIEDAPIVKLVNTILRQAITMAASDVHIEPWENKLQVRFRLDGQLHKVMSFPITITNALISRIKIISQMDIAERRRPQDGRVKLRMGKKRVVDYRVSIVPTVWGERVVMRVLDRASLQIDLTKLGFDAPQLELFKRAIKQPYGLILCTGPTGSGKTTTLYSALNSLDSGSHNILTAEDPVEYNFPGIAQVQINEQIGVTFASVLRSFLRQDPDIIMVGEIRDSETAEICTKAALTGHLVLSTVHTNDAPAATGRLIDLGLKPYLVSASLLMVIAQRLLRKICSQCKVEVTTDKQVLVDAGFTKEEADGITLFHGRGCDLCGGTGFWGRTGIYEIMPVTCKIKSAIAADLPGDQIKDIAIHEGMKDLRRCALEKVISGITTLEEALQNTLTE